MSGCTHLDSSWLLEQGPAYCEVCGYVDTTGQPIDPITGRRLRPAEGPSPIALLYAVDEDETLLFIPKALALQMLDARRRVARCRTWGDARRLLSGAWLARLHEDHAVGEPDDGEPLDGRSIAEGRWPSIRHGEMNDWLPARVLADLGERYEGILDSGVLLPAEHRHAILRALARAGHRCRKDDRIVELFTEQS
jgi:hypothetical protein